MAKNTQLLTAITVKKLVEPGSYADGEGLYLQISQTGSKAWFYRYEKAGKGRKHGLGSFQTVSLKEARVKADICRTLRDKGIDPIDHKKQQDLANELEKVKGVTFRNCALAYIESHSAGWKNRKHEQQWRNTLETYAFPVIGKLAVHDVDTGQVLKVLEPVWFNKTETASRVRQRIENILDWAKVRKYRTGENPALWRGHLDKILPKRTKVQKVKHFSAMPYADVPKYYRNLRKLKTVTAKSLAFIILTATRSSEARGATWEEIDLKKGIWQIPDDRMKADRPHRVPLSKEAIAILEAVKPFQRKDGLVFPGLKQNRVISEAACMKLLKADHPTLTIHGFRSSFRDWCAEMTSYPREVAEAALAHTLKDKTEAAYQRGDIFMKRHKLMDAWTNHCLKGKNSAKVVPIKKWA
jgi:integrase